LKQAEGMFTLSAWSNWNRRITRKMINIYRLWWPLSEDDLVDVIHSFSCMACDEEHEGITFTWAEDGC